MPSTGRALIRHSATTAPTNQGRGEANPLPEGEAGHPSTADRAALQGPDGEPDHHEERDREKDDDRRYGGHALTMTTPAGYAVSDEVWRDVEPLARATDRRERRLTRRVFGAAVLLALVYALVWWSGMVHPHLRASGSGGSSAVGAPTPSGTETIDVGNLGWFQETVTGVSTTHPGLRISRVVLTPQTLAPGQQGGLAIDWTADCALAAPVARGLGGFVPIGADIAVTVRANRPWGHATQTVSLSDQGALYGFVTSVCHLPTDG